LTLVTLATRPVSVIHSVYPIPWEFSEAPALNDVV